MYVCVYILYIYNVGRQVNRRKDVRALTEIQIQANNKIGWDNLNSPQIAHVFWLITCFIFPPFKWP